MSESTENKGTENAEPAVPAVTEQVKKSTQPKIFLHVAADLTLVIGEEEQAVHVLKAAMQAASPVWKAMFRPEWSDSQKSTIDLHEDNSEAMLILLRIAHHRHQDLPKELTWMQLQELAVACDKCDTVHVVRHFLTSLGWLKHHESMFQNPGQPSGLFLLWTLGDVMKFTALAQDIVMNSELDESCKMVWNGNYVQADSYSKDLVVDLVTLRQSKMQALLKICRDVYEKARDPKVCGLPLREYQKRKCRSMIFGAVMGLLSESYQCKYSKSLNNLVQGLNVFYQTTNYPHVSHRECVKFLDISGRVKEATGDLSDILTDVQKRHLEIQAKKGA